MASEAIRALWAQAVPEQDPWAMAARGNSKHIADAYMAARISELEVRRLEGYLAMRDQRRSVVQTGTIDG